MPPLVAVKRVGPKTGRYNDLSMPLEQEVCVYRFKIVLRGVSPMVWRRLLLRSDQTIADLHYAIQIAMNWSDQHLNCFHIHGKDYGVAHSGGISFSSDPGRVSLDSFRFRLRERFLYEYDFYDNWVHEIRLEKVLPLSAKRVYPVCVSGARAAPLEDCGGAQSYMECGDPRWQQWWEKVPRQELLSAAATVKQLIQTRGTSLQPGEGEKVVAAVAAWKEHYKRRPDQMDRAAVNERLRQYARGDRQWLFCEIIGG